MSEQRDEILGRFKEYEDNTESRKDGKNIPDNVIITNASGVDVKVGAWPVKGHLSVIIDLPEVGTVVKLPVTVRTKGDKTYLNLDSTREITSFTQTNLDEVVAANPPKEIDFAGNTPEVVKPSRLPVVKDFGEFAEHRPSDLVGFWKNAADTLQIIVKEAKLSVKIQGRDYMKFEGWQAVAGFFGATASVESTKPVYDSVGVLVGFEARAVVIDKKGREISAAEAFCGKDEPSWAKKPDFQLRSMAQTRASAKALRNVFAGVVVLAGLAATPAEEMQDEHD